jgi:hypothetical protein
VTQILLHVWILVEIPLGMWLPCMGGEGKGVSTGIDGHVIENEEQGGVQLSEEVYQLDLHACRGVRSGCRETHGS